MIETQSFSRMLICQKEMQSAKSKALADQGPPNNEGPALVS